MRRRIMIALLSVSMPASAVAQHGGAAAAPRTAPAEAKQFGFLVGQWELVVKPKVPGLAARIHGSPKLAGTWKAWRAFDGFGIEDELRITDLSGNPRSFSHAMRFYDASSKRWTVSTLDVYRGVFTPSTAEWRDGALTTSSRGADPEGKQYVSRTRYYDITPTSFRFRQDRSFDNGSTWDEGVLAIDARRVAASAPR